MNRSVWTVITCTMLLVVICNFNTMKAAPANNTQVPAKTTPKPAAPSTPKPAAPSTAKLQPNLPVKNAAPTTPKPAAPSTKRPHDERGVMAAATAPIILGLVGQVIGYIMQYIAS
ncbi:unnamed protein product [Schistosoma mattheei]|uniref:Uncharacterized protein n=2 Tax=Schistosoma mattheei TaxID=31246 RepID=A0AA85B2N9_9TREM|nr:unnamed protein product [Schistosoma mattheei]